MRWDAHTYGTTSLCRARLMQAVCSRVAPFGGLFALLLVLLETCDILIGEEEAVARERGGAKELEYGFSEGY
jgi:hypothetical protein